MNEQLRQFYDYTGMRWGGGAAVHLEFNSPLGLATHVEVVNDKSGVPQWIKDKMVPAQLAEVTAQFAISKPYRLAFDLAQAQEAITAMSLMIEESEAKAETTEEELQRLDEILTRSQSRLAEVEAEVEAYNKAQV